MKTRYGVFLAMMTLCLVLLGTWNVGHTQGTIKVTFNLNTSTNLDTLGEDGFVQIRGSLNWQTGALLPGGKTIDWNATSDLVMQNVGGDYWTITFEMEPEDTLYFKFWTGFDANTGTHPNGGWEGPFNPADPVDADTRTFISGTTDTVVALQYYHPGSDKVDQMWRPFESKPDTVAIYFRVNMGGVMESERFNPDVNGPVGVRGDPGASSGYLDWGSTKLILNREMGSVNNGSFWSGVLYIPKDSIEVGTQQEYKFFIENDTENGWENNVGNRKYVYTATLVNVRGDTTLHWRYFDDLQPTGQQPYESTVTFQVNLEALEKIGLFDRGVGDKIGVLGPKGWDAKNDLIELDFVALLQAWATSEPLKLIPGSMVAYKYFIVWDSSRVDPNSPNYIPFLDLGDGWEEPGLTGGSNRLFEFKAEPNQTPPGDFGKEVQFFDTVPPKGVIETPIKLTFQVDMRPAADPNTNTKTLFRPGTDQAFIQFDGSMFSLSQGMSRSGENARIPLEDPDGDGIYTATMDSLKLPVWYMVSYIIAYTTETGGIETNGGGLEKGRRYYQYVHPEKVNDDGTVVWPAEYVFPVVTWKEKDLDVEDPPDLDTPTGVLDDIAGGPETFQLAQNYPNPFNPETEIRYDVPKNAHVKIAVYNMMGQLVKTLVDRQHVRGQYKIKWNGLNDQGQSVASGVYFLKMTSGDFLQVRKMALVR